jgi:hypothetical protein
VKIRVKESRPATRTSPASARSIGRSRYFSHQLAHASRIGFAERGQRERVGLHRLQIAFCPGQDPRSRYVASVKAGQTVMSDPLSVLSEATHAS